MTKVYGKPNLVFRPKDRKPSPLLCSPRIVRHLESSTDRQPSLCVINCLNCYFQTVRHCAIWTGSRIRCSISDCKCGVAWINLFPILVVNLLPILVVNLFPILVVNLLPTLVMNLLPTLVMNLLPTLVMNLLPILVRNLLPILVMNLLSILVMNLPPTFVRNLLPTLVTSSLHIGLHTMGTSSLQLPVTYCHSTWSRTARVAWIYSTYSWPPQSLHIGLHVRMVWIDSNYSWPPVAR